MPDIDLNELLNSAVINLEDAAQAEVSSRLASAYQLQSIAASLLAIAIHTITKED